MRHQKIKKKLSRKPKKKTRSSYRAEYKSYQKDNPLTQYVERVCGINSAEKN